MNHDHEHGQRGHEHDQGIKGALRYLRWLPSMWSSEINDAVVESVGPSAAETVVDIGAGMGAGAISAARSGASVVAVEPTPFMRRVLAGRRLLSRARSHLEVVDGTAERLPVDDAGADAVWAVNTMHHWIDVDRGVAEIARVLRPGGRVLLVDEDFADPSHPDHERLGSDHHEEGDEHHHGFTMVDADSMGNLMEQAGLIDVVAAKRNLAGRPVISVAGRRATT